MNEDIQALPTAPGDTQVVELLGRNRLVSELLAAGLEVSLPMRDHGIDVVAYLDLDPEVGRFIARPIQMKAAWQQSFSLFKKYERFPDLILSYIWNLKDPQRAVTYALTYKQALEIASALRWTETASWKAGWYSTSRPSRHTVDLLQPYLMTAGRWRSLVAYLES